MYLLKKRLAIHSLSLADYESLLAVSDGCAICGTVPVPPKVLRIDHDHQTGRVRGLLCDTCNCGIGHLKDDKKNLASAIQYLGG